MSKPTQGPTPAQRLFRDWLESGASTEFAAFESWCAEHDEHESELRSMYAAWLVLAPALEPKETVGSLDARLASQFGTGVNPHVDLRDDPASQVGSQAGSAEVLSRLASRGPVSTRYSMKGEVARGGMGAIFRVWDEDLRRHLAMKVILGSGEATETGDTPAPDPKLLSRFLEEAQVTGQLDHPGIVPVHELGLDPSGRVFFTMKLVKGKTLGEVLDELAEGEGGWTRERVLGVLLKVCEAMAYAHDREVIHRDLKPSNIMVGKYGEVYVMDWGLARILGRSDERDLRLQQASTDSMSNVRSDRRDVAGEGSDSPLYTMDGDVVGTPAYMPPEQANGDIGALGPHSDVYAVGAMLYHLLAGHMPYVQPGAKASNYTILRWVQEGPPLSLDEGNRRLSPELVAICERAMARNSLQRYSDMGGLAEDLRAFLENRVVRAHQTGPVAELRKWVERNRTLAATVLGGLVLALGGTTTTTLVVASKNEEVRSANEGLMLKTAEADENANDARRQRQAVFGLSSFRELVNLEREARNLFPPKRGRSEDARRWIASAEALLATLDGGQDGYPGHRAQLTLVASRAVPQAAEQREAERRAHPRFAEWEAMRQRVEWQDYVVAIRRGERDCEVYSLSEDELAMDAAELYWSSEFLAGLCCP